MNLRARLKVLGATLTLLAVGLAMAPAHAAPILLNQGSSTLDSATGLAWLDLSLTAGQSYDSISAGYGGYAASGWRYATSDQVAQLFSDAGGAGGYPQQASTVGNNTTFQTALALSSLEGATFYTGDAEGFEFAGKGLISTAPESGSHAYASFVGALINSSNTFVGILNTGSLFGQLDDRSDPTVGSFLVRSTLAVTPVPAALPLFLTAVGGLGFAGWRRRIHRITES